MPHSVSTDVLRSILRQRQDVAAGVTMAKNECKEKLAYPSCRADTCLPMTLASEGGLYFCLSFLAGGLVLEQTSADRFSAVR